MSRFTATIGLILVLSSPALWAQRAERERPRARRAGPAASAPAQPLSADDLSGSVARVYRTVGDVQLKLHFCMPADHKPADRRPAIVFFFGGGWSGGSPGQFIPQCRYLASRGMVAAAADYRVYSRHQATIADCTSDAQAAVRWLRGHAAELGIHPDRIVAAGGSAGGHLAAATATLRDFTGEAGSAMSFRPNALILFNPAIDLTLDRTTTRADTDQARGILSRAGAPPEDLSPMDHVRPGLPPTIIFHGKEDNLIPFAKIEEFAAAMKKAGNRCEVVGFDGQGHGFFNLRRGQDRYFTQTLVLTDRFLTSLGYLTGEPTLDLPTASAPASLLR